MINLTAQTHWIAVPSFAAKSGIIFVHKRATALFGNRVKTSDFFARDGEPSRLAVEIFRIGESLGLTALTAELTACPNLIRAAKEAMHYAEEEQ